MIQSMTGFGFSKLSNKNFEISCEIKSVNSKFIDIHFKSAQQSFSVEEHLNQKLKSVFSRGQFDVRLNILGGISPKLSINNDVLAQLNKEIKKSKHLETATLKFSDIKNFPGAVSLSEDSAISDAHLKKVINKFELNAEVINENIFDQKKLNSDLIVARAFKPLPVILDLVTKNFDDFKDIILFLGKSGKSSIEQILKKWNLEFIEKKSVTEKDSIIIKINKVSEKK